jgi:hypothetical protein
MFEPCCSNILTRVFCETLQLNQGTHVANTISKEDRNGRGQLADEYFVSCMMQGTLGRRINDVMKRAVTQPHCVPHSSRRVILTCLWAVMACKADVFMTPPSILGKQHLRIGVLSVMCYSEQPFFLRRPHCVWTSSVACPALRSW